MTTTQKIEMSREIRQWVGIAVTALGGLYMINPEGTTDALKKIKEKVMPSSSDVE